MSVLCGATNGLFHPYADPFKVVQDKLCLSVWQEPTGDQKRGLALEDQARQWFSEKHPAAIRRTDLVEKINQHVHQKYPWWKCNVDDVWEVDGGLEMVDYKIPSLEGFKEWQRELPWYYEIQLHHYWGIAQDLGLVIKSLKVVAFNCDQWDGWVGEVEMKSDQLGAIGEIGDWFWNTYVLKGDLPPRIRIKSQKDLEELALESEEKTMVDQYIKSNWVELKAKVEHWSNVAWGSAMLVQEAEKSRESATWQLQQQLPLRALSFEVQKIEVGGVRLKPDWKYSQLAVLETIKNGLERLGESEDAIKKALGQENFWKPAQFDWGLVEEILLKDYQINIRSNEKFFAARSGDPELNIESITQYLRSLEKVLPQGVDWELLVDWNASKLKVEMQRSTMAGWLKERRLEMSEQSRPLVHQWAMEKGQEYKTFLEVKKSGVIEEELASKKTPRRSKKP